MYIMNEFDHNDFFFECFLDYEERKFNLFIYNIFVYFDFLKDN